MPPLDHSFISLFTYSLIHSLVNSYICTLTHLSQSSPVSLKMPKRLPACCPSVSSTLLTQSATQPPYSFTLPFKTVLWTRMRLKSKRCWYHREVAKEVIDHIEKMTSGAWTFREFTRASLGTVNRWEATRQKRTVSMALSPWCTHSSHADINYTLLHTDVEHTNSHNYAHTPKDTHSKTHTHKQT